MLFERLQGNTKTLICIIIFFFVNSVKKNSKDNPTEESRQDEQMNTLSTFIQVWLSSSNQTWWLSPSLFQTAKFESLLLYLSWLFNLNTEYVPTLWHQFHICHLILLSHARTRMQSLIPLKVSLSLPFIVSSLFFSPYLPCCLVTVATGRGLGKRKTGKKSIDRSMQRVGVERWKKWYGKEGGGGEKDKLWKQVRYSGEMI